MPGASHSSLILATIPRRHSSRNLLGPQPQGAQLRIPSAARSPNTFSVSVSVVGEGGGGPSFLPFLSDRPLKHHLQALQAEPACSCSPPAASCSPQDISMAVYAASLRRSSPRPAPPRSQRTGGGQGVTAGPGRWALVAGRWLCGRGPGRN